MFEHSDDRVNAVKILLNELGNYGANNVFARSEGDKLVMGLSVEHAPNLRMGEAQTLEPDHGIDRDAYALLKKLGVKADDVTVTRPQNQYDADTFEKSTIHGGGRQTYRDSPEFTVDIGKIDSAVSHRITEEWRVAKQLEGVFSSNTFWIARKARINFGVQSEKTEELYALVKQKMDQRGVAHYFPPALVVRNPNSTYNIFYHDVVVDVAKTGADDAKLILASIVEAQSEIKNHRLIARDDRLADVDGMRDAADHVKTFLEKMGCEVTSVQRVFGQPVFNVTLSRPILGESLEYLHIATKKAANAVNDPGQDLEYSMFGDVTATVPAQRPRTSPEQNIASFISHRPPKPERADQPLVSGFQFGIVKSSTISGSQETLYRSPAPPEELVRLFKKMADANWEGMAKALNVNTSEPRHREKNF